MRGNDIAVVGKIYPRGKDEDFLRYGASGTAYVPFNLSAWSHKNDEGNNEYISYQCIVFGDMAENLAESIVEGDTVIVTGRLQANNWVTDDGDKRYDQQLMVDEIGLSVRWNPVNPQRVERTDYEPQSSGTGDESVF